jgi:hypothetical protein
MGHVTQYLDPALAQADRLTFERIQATDVYRAAVWSMFHIH